MGPKKDVSEYVIEEPRAVDQPTGLGAAGWRDMARLPSSQRSKADDIFIQDLRVRLKRGSGQIVGLTVEIGEHGRGGYVLARYEFVRAIRWSPEQAQYTCDDEEQDEKSIPERTRKRLSIDRHQGRLQDLLQWAQNFDREVANNAAELGELAKLVAETRWSRRGPTPIITEEQIELLSNLSVDEQVQRIGVDADSIRKYKQRRNRKSG